VKASAACLLGLALAGCQSAPRPASTPEVARFFLESVDGAGEQVTLPQSGVQILVQPKPVITEFDIANVELARVELGLCLAFELTPAAAGDLHRLTAANQGRRLVLLLGGVPFGARYIAQPMDRGTVLIFIEVPDAALPALVANLKETCAALQPATPKR
jgi:hypothetical protein